MQIKAICTDIDGTLLDSRRELSERTIAVIKRVSKDVPVILASSRMPRAMRHLQKELGIAGDPMVCFNGGYVIDFGDEGDKPIVIDSVSMSSAVCSAILEEAKGTSIHVSVYLEDNWYAPAYDEWAQREERNTKVTATIATIQQVVNDWHNLGKGAHKVMCMGPEDEIKTLADTLDKKLLHDIHVYRSKSTYLEIAPKAISKATALSLLLNKKYNIDMNDVMAFGDNYNDIVMLQSAGLGIAVANAGEEVKAVAKDITLKNTDDGVAVAIEKYEKFIVKSR